MPTNRRFCRFVRGRVVGSVLGVRLAAPAPSLRCFRPTPRYARREWGRARPRRWPQLPWRAVTAPLLKWLPPHRSHQEGFLYVRNAGVYGPFGLIPGRASRAIRSDARSPIEGHGTDLQAVTHYPPGGTRAFGNSYSPDGQWISLRIEQDGLSALFQIHPDGTDLTQITPFSDFRPRNMAWGSALAHRLANGH